MSQAQTCRYLAWILFIIGVITVFGCKQKTNAYAFLQDQEIVSEDTIIKLKNVIDPDSALIYRQKYDSLFKSITSKNSGFNVVNPQLDTFAMPMSYIGFFKGMAKSNHLFRGNDQVIWTYLVLDTVGNNSSPYEKKIKLYAAVQNNQDTGTIYYDLITKSNDGYPIQISTGSAQSNIAAYNTYITAVKNTYFSDTSQYCQFKLSGFQINYTDLSQLSKLSTGSMFNAVLALKPCCDQPKLSTIDLFIQCNVRKKSKKSANGTASLVKENAYFDFTLPCPNNCPE